MTALHVRTASPVVDACDLLILQPAIRPGRSGVTDHSLALAAALELEGLTVRHLDIADPSQRCVLHTIPYKAVLFQLSLYGYQLRGTPLWLPQFIADARQRHPTRPWITFFHELWACRVPPHRSAFWLAPWQRRICRDIADASSHAIFNTVWGLQFGRERVGDRAAFMPTASNIGEPDTVPEFRERAPSLVVFGGAWSRQHCYADSARLHPFMDRMGIDRVVDIGEPLDRVPAFPSHIDFQSLGWQPDVEVSRRLLDARFGLFVTPWGLASKSGVFAAYRSHGVVPVCAWSSPDPSYGGAPGPELDVDFTTLDRPMLSGALSGEALRRRYAEGGIRPLAQAIVDRALS